MPDLDKYDLLDDGLLTKIKGDETAFVRYITWAYLGIAAEHHCEINLTNDALCDTWVYWVSDLGRVLDHDTDDRTEELDHFKHAAFLTFWLRRLVPLRFIHFTPPTEMNDATEVEFLQRWFAMYGNEICALNIGLKIVHAYEMRSLDRKIAAGAEDGVHDLRAIKRGLTESVGTHPDFQADCISTLKHKNNSPHSINLMFKALYLGIASKEPG